MMSLTNTMQRAAVHTDAIRIRSPALVQPVARRALHVVRTQEKTKESGGQSDLNQKQLDEVAKIQVGDISPQKAEMRADMGSGATVDLLAMQAFDGPAPEAINGRTAMLGVMAALYFEFKTGMGLKEQIADHPLLVIASVVIFTIATYVPLSKGVTRREAYESGIWTVNAENQNGRLAMMGFLAMVVGEAVSGSNILHMWGLQ